MSGLADIAKPMAGVNVFLNAQTPEQVTADEAARAEAARPDPQAPVMLNLAAYIRNAFSIAEQHRNERNVTTRLIDCQRRRKGEYDPEKLAQIQQRGGNDTYFNLTKTKCTTCEAWLQDVMAPAGDDPWDIEPTPIPALSEQMNHTVIQGVMANYAMTGTPIDVTDVQQFTLELYDETLKRIIEDAKERIGRMKRLIQDQLTEGGFIQAILKFNYYFTTYPTAYLKGPILRKRKRLKWQDNQVSTVEELVHEWEAPNPQKVYPKPNARSIKDGVYELVDYSVKDLMAARAQEGWNTDAINRVLREVMDQGALTTVSFLTGDTERADAENRDMSIHGGIAPGTVQGIACWDDAPVKLLREWGMPGLESEDDHEFKAITGLLIGTHMVYAILNPDPLGDIPWSEASFEPEPDSVWGNALPEEIKDCQDPYNAALRCYLDNLAIASGPQVAVDVDALAEGQDATKQWPWKVWFYNGQQIANGTRKPVDWHQPNPLKEVLTDTAKWFQDAADERSRIPRYTHGEADVGGAGETASGLSMLMTAANKGIKRLIGFIDYQIIRTAVTRQYLWNMLYHEDQNVKADAQVRPRGILALLVKEQVQLRRQEFLDRTNNPVDMTIIGVEGRGAVLRAVAQGLDLPEDKVVPSEDELKMKAEAILAAQMTSPSPRSKRDESSSKAAK